MKKALLIILAIIASQTINAQLFKIGHVEIGYLYLGPKAGIHGSWMTNATQTGSDTETLMGYDLGVVGKFGITKKLSIQPELIFSRKGSKQSYTGGEGKTIAQYIGIPILAKISVIKIGDLMLHGSGGIYTNVTTSVVSKSKYGDYEEETDIKDDYKTIDFGISFGGGATYELDHGLLVGEITLEHGVIDTQKNNTTTESYRNTTVGINVAYLFDFAELSTSLFKKE